jgi:hypothetical protein
MVSLALLRESTRDIFPWIFSISYSRYMLCKDIITSNQAYIEVPGPLEILLLIQLLEVRELPPVLLVLLHGLHQVTVR